jgi:large subunit ribosomal protein L25
MNYRKLVLKGLPAAIPENIELDITDLKIGDVIRAGKINLPGCKIMQSDSAVIVSVKTTRAAMSAASEGEEGEEEAAPEAAPAE